MSDTATKKLTPKQADREQAIGYLKESLQPGDTVYVILRYVSKSGMSRLLDLYLVKTGRPFRITWNAAKALELTYDRRQDSLRINGCGMDMGFEVVYRLAWAVFNDPDALKHQWL